MRLTKTIFTMAATLATTVGYAGLFMPFRLDMANGTRVARETESIAYASIWGEGAPADARAVVAVEGTTLINATEEGAVVWIPTTNGTYTLTHKVMSRGVQYGETLTAIFNVVGPKVSDVVAKQRYPWNGLVDITCKVTGINGTTNGLKFAVATVMPDSNTVCNVSDFWVVQNGTKLPDSAVHSNGNYRLLWDASADLGQVAYDNMVMRVTVVELHDKVQLWEGGPYWAETNIGAEKPWEYGYYFWWGDTVGYKRENNKWVATDGSSSNFSFDSSNTPTYSKSIATLKSEGWITADEILMPAHDAAHEHWGGAWRMPTIQELDDLVSQCDWTWTVINGVSGYVVKGKGAYASASIFLPCAGSGDGTEFFAAGSHGCFWSSVPSLYDARCLCIDSISPSAHDEEETPVEDRSRLSGLSVRPVQRFTE